MSAFSAFSRKLEKAFCFPEPGDLRKSNVYHSNIHLTTSNTIHTPDAIIVGLNYQEYLLIEGCYKLTLLRGKCLVNSIHLIPAGKSFIISSDNIESIPTISVPYVERGDAHSEYRDGSGAGSERTGVSDAETIYSNVLVEFDTLIEIGNESNGISEATMFVPQLMGLGQRYGNYTFKVILPAETNKNPSILVPNEMTRALNRICGSVECAVVFGVAHSGKQTFAKALINCLLLSKCEAVAYLDLDPMGPNIGRPHSLSLRVYCEPLFGSFPLIHESDFFNLEKDCYYGYSHCYEMPEFYITQCKRLIRHYNEHVKSLGIPLVVKYPSWVKGLGKEVLCSIHRYLQPQSLIYCKHENATELLGFQPQAFETEHSQAEMLAAFKSPQTNVVSAVRKGAVTTKHELKMRSVLLHLHQRGTFFDFDHFLIDTPPNKLLAQHVAAISVLNFETDVPMNFGHLQFLAEATVMGVFAFSENILPKLHGKYLNGSDFTALDPHFIGLCVVHSVSEDFFCIYVNDHQHFSNEIRLAMARKNSLVLARGDGQIPTVEFEAHGHSGPVPYIGNTKLEIGGTWEVRKNIARKTI